MGHHARNFHKGRPPQTHHPRTSSHRTPQQHLNTTAITAALRAGVVTSVGEGAVVEVVDADGDVAEGQVVQNAFLGK